MKFEPIASGIEDLADHYTVVVVGSGYGASVAASRLARAGKSVCVLERGREILPGDYPDTPLEARAQMQWTTAHGRHGDPSALYAFHVGTDINVLSGCGLGGTSLINANVSLEADPRVFARGWPEALRADVDHGLADGVARALEMLGAAPLPETRMPAKLVALGTAAAALDLKATRPRINVTFEGDVNAAGVEQAACTGCGDCVTGCNVGAKNTLLMNYLPDARRHDARIVTEVDVSHIEREGDRWSVAFRPLGVDREDFDGDAEMRVTADVVVLGAGSLGSTEILLRSAEQGLSLSPALGTHFSGNGDVLGFAYAGTDPVHGVGHGDRPATGREWVGPTITGLVDVRAEDVDDSFVIEEGAIPGAIASIVPGTFAVAASLQHLESDLPAALTGGAYRGPVDRSSTFLVMGHDDAGGRMALDAAGQLRIDWPDAGGQPNIKRASDALHVASTGLGGRFVANPVWAEDQDRPLVTVHPLGGCPMGEDAATGVVDHRSRVFAGATGTAVHDGLYVMDASIVPRSLGVNPLLTITGLAERATAMLAADRGWTISYDGVAPAPAAETPSETLRFTERMAGFVAPPSGVGSLPEDHVAAAEAGEAAGTSAEFLLTIVAEDVVRFLDDPARPAVAAGTVTVPALHDEPLTVTRGVFNLFAPDADRPDVQHMIYRLPLAADDGRRWFLSGVKVIDRGRLRSLWHDTTTLYVDIHRDDESGPVVYRGVLRIGVGDFTDQLRSMTVEHATSESQRLRLLARFGAMFAGNLWDHYGGIFGGLSALDRDAPPRVKRPLRCGVPEVHAVETDDGVELQLLRYRGGDRGPVVLVHGMGACSGLFTIDTIDTNLTEYLWEEGFDVWLLDWRGSILIPASSTSFDADECARYDYPAASKKIMELTGADGLHWIAHCVGSITFFMSLLGGLEDVKSVVALQVAAHTIPPMSTTIKCALHVPSVLQALGMKALSAETYDEGFSDRAFNQALRLTPLDGEERCSSAVCLRCTFLYSLCWRHANLNAATHDAIHEMMGVANLEMMEHLARCASHKRVVDMHGDDTYLPHLDRLSMPITLIQGEDNQVWRLKATETTYEALVEQFGEEHRDRYHRVVIPGYGHLDTVFGKNAVHDTYPAMLEHLARVGA
jgi:cholesterol oxidase